MAGVNQVFSLADDVARLIATKGDDAVGIFCRKAKSINPTELKGLRLAPEVIKDDVHLSFESQAYKDFFDNWSKLFCKMEKLPGVKVEIRSSGARQITFLNPAEYGDIVAVGKGSKATIIDFYNKNGELDSVVFENYKEKEILEFLKKIREKFSKQSKWKNIERKEQKIADINPFLRPTSQYPSGTSSISEIIAEDIEGGKTKIVIFRDSNGKSLGSKTLFPDGKTRDISITEIPKLERQDCATGGKSYELTSQGYKAKAKKVKTITRYPEENKIEDVNAFSEFFERPNDKQKYLSVVRIKKTSQKKLSDNITQEVLEIESGKAKPNFKRIKFNSTRNKDNTMTLNSVERQGEGVETIDTSHPYFQTMFLEPEILLKSKYAEDVKELGLGGIAPSLSADRLNWGIFERGMDKASLGTTFPDGTTIGVNLSGYYTGRVPKTLLVEALRHEEEHLFKQLANVHRAGIKDMRTNSETSKRFYDGIVKRLGHINPGTKEYEEAQKFCYEFENYKNIAYANGRFNLPGYSSLIIEQKAFDRGRVEGQIFQGIISQFKKVFGLLNTKYIDYNC